MPVSKMSRTAVAGGAAMKIGAKKLSLLSKKPFLSKDAFQSESVRHENESAKTLFAALSQLRGTALKIAQILSLETEMLPEAYRKELQKSYYQVPPLNRAVVRRLVISELGREPEAIFKDFESEAFAAASLGQVHRATSHKGEKLAVKVQYPGVSTTIKNDLELVKSYLVPYFKSSYVLDATKEVEARLAEEVDYQHELKNTRWFKEHVKTPRVSIPKTYEAYSTKAVLTTELLSGQHIEAWLETNPSQEARNACAQTIWDLCMESFFAGGKMHTDPNPGNYLFGEDGAIGLIDFGSVKDYTAEFRRDISHLWNAHIRRDHKTVREYYIGFGISPSGYDELYKGSFGEFGEWLAIPFKTEIFDFRDNQEYCQRGLKHIRGVIGERAIEGFTTENIMFDRNIHGLYRIFTRMNARVRFNNQWIGNQA